MFLHDYHLACEISTVRTHTLSFCDCFVDIYSDCEHLPKDKELKDCDISNCSFPADSYSKPFVFISHCLRPVSVTPLKATHF